MMGVEGMTLGVIFGNRDFFPDGLVAEARRDLLELLKSMGVAVVTLTPEQTAAAAALIIILTVPTA